MERSRDVGADLIYQVSFQLTETIDGFDGEVLRKSLQELLFEIAGTDPSLGAGEVVRRLPAFLERRGRAGLLRRFLSLHLFNVVWFHTSDSFRLRAWTTNSFLDDMGHVESDCRRIVDSIWRSQKITGPLDLASAVTLVERLAERLIQE